MRHEVLFGKERIGKLIAKTCAPAMFTILVMMLYNMADIFFIGRTGDAKQVASIALVAPVMSILSGLGTLVGSGGCAAIAIELGKGNAHKARQMSSFSAWFSVVLGIVFAVGVTIFMQPLLFLLGTSEATRDYASSYFGIIAYGAPVMIFASTMASVVRAEGGAKESMVGNMVGSVVNVVLDPILILALDMGVKGAAIATVLGNLCASAFFIRYMLGKRCSLSLSPHDFSLAPSISIKVISLGLPTAIGVLLMSVSNILRNNVVSGYGDTVIAAMGVAGKVSMISSMLQMGLCMGIQPAIAYNYGARAYDRMKKILRSTTMVTVVLGTMLTLFVVLSRETLVTAFLNDAEVIAYGTRMALISVLTGPFFGLYYLSTNFLQGTGKAIQASFVALLRQGLLFVPLLFTFNSLYGLNGLLFALPVSDLFATITGISLLLRQYRSISRHSAQDHALDVF